MTVMVKTRGVQTDTASGRGSMITIITNINSSHKHDQKGSLYIAIVLLFIFISETTARNKI